MDWVSDSKFDYTTGSDIDLHDCIIGLEVVLLKEPIEKESNKIDRYFDCNESVVSEAVPKID